MTLAASGYKTKKALKESIGKPLGYNETSMFGPEYKSNGKFAVVGPSAYERKWFAEVTMVDGKIAKVS
jgi:hypothetical protein